MRLDDMRGWMHGEDCVVVGKGPSARGERSRYRDLWTMGCNQAAAWCDADFICCPEPVNLQDLWEAMRSLWPFAVFTHINPKVGAPLSSGSWRKVRERPHPRLVPFDDKKNGARDVIAWLDPTSEGHKPLSLAQSPFFGAAAAIALGFDLVGVIGVDYPEDRWPCLAHEERAWERLEEVAEELGTRLVNLNPESRLEALPFMSWEHLRKKRKEVPSATP